MTINDPKSNLISFSHISGINIVELQKRWQEDMQPLTAAFLECRNGIESWTLPFRRFQEDMQKLAEPFRQIQDEIRKWIEPQQKFQQQMQRLLEPYRQLQEQTQKLIEPYRYWQNDFQGLKASFTALSDYVVEITRMKHKMPEFEVGIRSILDSFKEEAVSIDDSGTITIGNETVSREEIEGTFNDIFKVAEKLPSPSEVVASIWAKIKNLPKPFIFFLLSLVIQFVVNVCSNLATPHIEEVLSKIADKPRREQIKLIKSESAKQFDISVLREFRFVSTEVLHVRSEESTKAKILADIRFGQVVRVIKKGRSWSYIECAEQDAEIPVRGWVFSRYLRRFEI